MVNCNFYTGSTYSKELYRFPELPEELKDEFIFGSGAYINGYLDLSSSLGALTYGYRSDFITAICEQATLCHILPFRYNEIECSCAEKICKCVNTEKAFFLKTGSEACSAAVRLARAYTNRDVVVSVEGCYHGWHDWFACDLKINKGVPPCLKDLIRKIPRSVKEVNLSSLKKLKPACIILEPIAEKEYDAEFIDMLKELQESGILIIFDENITFPRARRNYSIYSIEPDLYVFGKGIANGLPLSVVAGKKEIIEQKEKKEVFVSGTFSAELLSLAAANFILSRVNEIREHINKVGEYFLSSLAKAGIKTDISFPWRISLHFDSVKEKSFVFEKALEENIILYDNIFLNYSHNKKEVDYVCHALELILQTPKEKQTPKRIIEDFIVQRS